MFGVYKVSPGGVDGGYIAVFENEIDAADYCDVHDWSYLDENRFEWHLDYREV